MVFAIFAPTLFNQASEVYNDVVHKTRFQIASKPATFKYQHNLPAFRRCLRRITPLTTPRPVFSEATLVQKLTELLTARSLACFQTCTIRAFEASFQITDTEPFEGIRKRLCLRQSNVIAQLIINYLVQSGKWYQSVHIHITEFNMHSCNPSMPRSSRKCLVEDQDER